jgi:hypothetical protein
MSKVYGQLRSDIGQTQRTRRGTQWIESDVKTWNGSVTVRVTPDEKAVINIDNLDVTINGTRMYRPRREELEIPMKDLLQLMEKRWKKESAKYARLPKKEFQSFRDLMLVQKVFKKLEGD